MALKSLESADSGDRSGILRGAGDEAQYRGRRARHTRRVDCVIDGLRVKRVGELTFPVVQRFVDQLVVVPDEQIFEAVVWTMSHCKLVVEGAARCSRGGVASGSVNSLPARTKVACVLSGGNVDLEQLKGMKWNSVACLR